MTTKKTHIKSIVRHGQTQKGRIKNDLIPDNVKLDDRTISDFILFAKRYSEYIKFYPLNNPDDRQWKSFWSNDISAVLASISAFPINDYLEFYTDLKTFIIKLISENKTAEIAKHFRLLFQLPIWITNVLTKVEPLLGPHPEFKLQFKTFLEQEVQLPLEQVISYFKGADDQLPIGFKSIDINSEQFNGIDDITIPDLIHLHLEDFSSFENANIYLPFSTKDWVTYYNDIPKNTNPYIEEISVKAKVFDALNYNLLIANIEALLETMVLAQNMFKKQFKKSLNKYPKHSPHYALWLCFAKLYQFQKEELNTFPKRHLEYYYQEILKQDFLKPKPTRAHILFELNKGEDKLLLKEGTLLNAGKDESGKDINYQLLDDLIVSQTKVSEIKSVYIEPSCDYPIAAIKTNTLDGIEEELEPPQTNWSPFFQGKETNGKKEPKGRLGFAIADSDLFLKEGYREITITVDQNLNETPLNTNHLEAYYTSDEAWEKVSIRKKLESNNQLIVKIASEKPAFVHFDPEIHVDDEHQDDFDKKLPILKIQLKSGYWSWKNIDFGSLEIDVRVEKVKDLFIQNKNGVMDTSKSFPVFGVTPDKLPSFLIGSNEIFSKTLKKLSLNIEWLEAYNQTDYFETSGKQDHDYDVRLEYLLNGNWEGQSSFVENMYKPFTENQKKHSIQFDTTVRDVPFGAKQSIENAEYSSTSKNGFIKIHVDRNFGHHSYPQKYSQEMIKLANDQTANIPNEPYPAIVDAIDIDYQTKSHAPDCFIELHPFGFAENDSPQTFIHKYEHVGYQYIGLSNLEPQEKVNILFQILSGTSDPLAEPANIEWSYLKDNQWETLNLEVDDKTSELARSAVIAFTIPKEATNNNTLLPKGYHWLRMAVPTHYKALNNLIGIHAQSALVEFKDQDNDLNYLNTPLEPNTITKLVKQNNKIKSLTQEYEGFNRRGTESSKHYYTRVSERLRHKNRAIQLWDYEHLILQNFPHLYRVKCLNHTRLDDNNRPGNVTIVALPKIQSLLKDPMKPYTDKQTRLDIYNLLKSRMSPFICLHVVQPKLESIQIECTIKFNDEYDDLIFYRDRLQEALIRHLTPWAFKTKKDVHFGGKWYKADIIDFIDEQPYVSYVKDLKMYHNINTEDSSFTRSQVDQEVIIASTPRSVLVSETSHLISPLDNVVITNSNEEDCNCKAKELI